MPSIILGRHFRSDFRVLMQYPQPYQLSIQSHPLECWEKPYYPLIDSQGFHHYSLKRLKKTLL